MIGETMERDSSYYKKFTSMFLKKWKVLLLSTVAGALILGIPYTLSKTIIGNFDYRAEVSVHVKYGEDSAGNMYDYINFYTWGQWITSDKYLDPLVEAGKVSVSKDELKEYLTAEVQADQRVVFFVVTTHDPKLTDDIAKVVSETVTEFVNDIDEVASAEVFNVSKAEKYFVYKNIPQVFMLGAIIGLFVSCIVVRLLILMDDSLYTKD